MFKTIKTRWLRETVSWVTIITLAVLLNLVLREHVFAITKIEGSSMFPTLENHQRVYLNRLAYTVGEPEHGDIVVFPAPHDARDYIKRVIGLPGDRVAIQDGHLYVNGEQQPETYIDTVPEDFPAVTVAPGHIFVMGDNRHPMGSLDSRDTRVGQVAIDQLKGRVDYVLYPTPRVL